MLKEIKKIRLFVALSLIIQAFTALITFIILSARHRSLSYAFLTVAGMTGVTGALMLLFDHLEEKAEQHDFNDLMDLYNDEDGDDFSFDLDDEEDGELVEVISRRPIPVDDTVDEAEFDR